MNTVCNCPPLPLGQDVIPPILETRTDCLDHLKAVSGLICRFPVQWLGRQRDDKQRTAILRQLQMDQEPAAGFSYGL